MGSSTGHILTLANSIIGVSVLAMPYCFKQCGILLSVLSLVMSNLITRLACHYLMKSAIMERMKNFEMLAFRAFGPHGKFTVEMCIIGFMLGTCVAYFVIMGDLGPTIIGPALGLEHVSALRPSVLIGVAIFVVLPLGLKRNVDSLSGLCAASIAFYLVLVLKVVAESAGNIIGGTWMDKVDWWRPAGLLQCVPIFSMALSCQTQLFEIFGTLPNTPLERANAIVKSAVNLTTVFYLSVGFFGYIAYCAQNLTGNLMLNFSSTATSELIKMGFILTVAVSFPLVIFPCRASIYSLLYSKSVLHTHHSHSHEPLGSAHIPETQFQCITLLIVTGSLIIGLLIPNIEIVLGLVGSTIGVFVCVITPGLIFISLSSKKNNERLMAQLLIGFGLVIMVLGTYANLYATEETLSSPTIKKFEPIVNQEEKAPVPMLNVKDLIKDEENTKEKQPKNKKIEKTLKKVVAPVIVDQPIDSHNAAKEEAPLRMLGEDSLEKKPKLVKEQLPASKLKKEVLDFPKAQSSDKKEEIGNKNNPRLETKMEHNVKLEPIISPAKRKPEKANPAALEKRDDSGKSAGVLVNEALPKKSNRSQVKPRKNIQSKLSQKMVENVPLPLALAQIEESANGSEKKVASPARSQDEPQPAGELPPKAVAPNPPPEPKRAAPVPLSNNRPPAEPVPAGNPVQLATESRQVSPAEAAQPIVVNNREILESREKRDTEACDKQDKAPDPPLPIIIKTPKTLSNGDEVEIAMNPKIAERTLVVVAGDASSNHHQGGVVAASQDQPHKRDLKSLEKQT